MFFANADFFKERVLEETKKAPTRARWVVIAAEPITSIDITAADTLDELNKALQVAGVKLCFAEMKDPVKDKLKRFGLFDQFGEEFFFPTVSGSVNSYLQCETVTSGERQSTN